MKAITYKKYGPPEVLEIEDIETPTPNENEVLIKVYAAEATKADCEMRSFKFAVKWFWLPLRLATGLFRPRNPVLGAYFAGKVEALGKNVEHFKLGDRVFACAKMRFGAYAEYTCLPGDGTIISLPNNLSYAQAAAVPLGGLNALHFLRKAQVKKGDDILINGAGGSIGCFAVQIAKQMGATVTAIDGAHKEHTLRQIGADHFIDYEREDFTKGGARYDVIFDMVPSSSYSACIALLKPHGRYVMGNPRFMKMLRSMMTGKFSNKKVYFAFAGETKEELTRLKTMIEAEQISPTVDTVYPMHSAIEAHYRVETEQRVGSVVITMSDNNASPAGDGAAQ